MTDDQIVQDALDESLRIVRRSAGRHTPAPSVGDFWRVRWAASAGVALITGVSGASGTTASAVEIAPVTFDTEPDETAVLAPASSHNLGFDVTIWEADKTAVSPRVLEAKLGGLTVPSTDGLSRGSRNWGPTDPRTQRRAVNADVLDELARAEWAPQRQGSIVLAEVLGTAELEDVIKAVGSLREAMRLRRGERTLTQAEAERLAHTVGRTANDLVDAGVDLPADLLLAMDQPAVRILVDRLAEQLRTDEPAAWLRAAQGVYALAAREHLRGAGPNWSVRINTYFHAALHDSGAKGGTDGQS